MHTTALKEITAFLFGRKYYANIINWRGLQKYEVCSYIFATRQEAQLHADSLIDSSSFRFITTISFRTRKELKVATYTPPTDE